MPLAEKWIRDHGDEYAGRWVALRDDVLVAHGRNFDELHAQLPSLEGLLLTPVFGGRCGTAADVRAARLRERSPNGRAAERDAGCFRPMPGVWDWYRAHADEYVGRWVALRDDVLVAEAGTYAELRAQLPTLDGVLVTRVA